jgi:hypothetical protein
MYRHATDRSPSARRRCRTVPGPLLGSFALSLALAACTDAGLYQWKHDPYQANKLTVSGTVCTDDPHQRNFPVKILFIIDTSSSLASDKNDFAGYRGRAVDDVDNLWSKSPNYSFGVVAYAGKGRNLIDTGFTRDSALLNAAAATVKGSGGLAGCIGGRCRDLRAAMSLASSILTGDILKSDPGEVARTTYVMALFAGGPPVPPIGRCNCRDAETETKPDNWASCPWTECDGCKVTCPPSSQCKDMTCIPLCSKACATDPDCGANAACNGGTCECNDDSFCSANYVCEKLPEDGGDPKPTVVPMSMIPTSIPDTFTQWIPPAKPNISLPPGVTACQNVGALQGYAPCVYAGGQGHVDSCEEKILVAAVREMKDFAKANGAAQFQLHTTYLADMETGRKTDDPFYPPCGPAADQARAIRLLSEMAFAGDGGFTQFGQATAISFNGLDLHTSREPLVYKELVVTNNNVVATASGNKIDTDADGIPDDQELLVKSLDGTKTLCPLDEDTDGDGISDGVEIKLAMDPLTPNDPVECIDLVSTQESGNDPCSKENPPATKTWRKYADKDHDGLNACEERLLGTQDSLMDSDADGIPDKVEFVAGTNYLAVDHLADSDFDGVVNREEIRGHTDPRSADSQSQLDLSYRYEEVDEGVKAVLSFTQPTNITGVTIKNASANSTAGVGWLKFDPGPPPTLAWRDSADMGPGGNFGPAVDVSKTNADGYKLMSCSLDSSTGGCSKDSEDRFLTVLVEGPAGYSPTAFTETIVLSSAMRNCLRFRVRNITLMQTGVHRKLNTPGNNSVMIYFAEAPRNAKDGYGIFRVKEIQLNYIKDPPPERRTPKAAEIPLSDDDFILFQ